MLTKETEHQTQNKKIGKNCKNFQELFSAKRIKI